MSNLPKLLSLGGMPTSGFFHVQDHRHTIHKYGGFRRAPFQTRGELEILEDGSSTSNRTKHLFKIPQSFHTMGFITLKGEFEALGGSAAVPGVTQKRLINWAAREQIQEIRIRSGQMAKRNIIIPGKLLQVEHWVGTLMRDKEALAVLELGDMTEAERTAAALGTQYWEVRIPTPWDIDTYTHLPTSALQDQLEIEIIWKDDSEILCYDGATAFPGIVRSNVTLYVETYLHYPEQYHFQIEDIFRPGGITYYKRDLQYEQIDFQASQINSHNEITINLDKYNNEAAFICASLTWADERAVTDNKGHDNLLPWTSHSITDGTLLIQGPIPYTHQVFNLNRQLTYYPTGLNLILHSNAEEIHDRGNTSGSLNYAGLNDGKFKIELDPVIRADMVDNGRVLRVDFAMLMHNSIQLLSKSKDPNNPRGILAEIFDIA